MFDRLKEQARKIFGREDRTVMSHRDGVKVERYTLYQQKVENGAEWEKQFQEYCNFDFVQDGKNYKIRLHFKEAESRKEAITAFVKEGMQETGGNLTAVLINVNIIYEMAVATRGIKEGNQILLFFNY